MLTCSLVATPILITAGACLFFAAEPLVRLFVRADQTEVIGMAAPLLRIVSFSMPALAPMMVLNGALRGAGDTRWPFAITLVGLLGVRIPGAYLLVSGLGWGVNGAWYAMVIDIWVRFLFVGARFLHGGWKLVRV